MRTPRPEWVPETMRLRIAQVATVDMSVHLLLTDHIRALQQARHQVTAVCAPGPFVDKIRAQGIEVHAVPMSRELSPARDLRALLALKRLFRERRFDVVHTHTPKAGLLGPLAARLAGVPVIVHTIHGLMFHDRMPAWRRGFFCLAEKFTGRSCHRLLSQSREDIDVAIQSGLCRREKIAYIGNGIDVQHFVPQDNRERRNGEVVIGSVGRLVAEKGFRELFEAASTLSSTHPELQFVVVGPDDPDQSDAVPPPRIAELKRTGAVRFPGWAEDMRAWYGVMDIFVLPSHREGVPRACMEAAAMGVPVIASDIRGCREVVKDGETGVLVPVRNPAALAHAIARLAADPQARRRMGENGRRHIMANFDQRQVLERLLNFYDDIEAGLGRRAAHA